MVLVTINLLMIRRNDPPVSSRTPLARRFLLILGWWRYGLRSAASIWDFYFRIYGLKDHDLWGHFVWEHPVMAVGRVLVERARGPHFSEGEISR